MEEPASAFHAYKAAKEEFVSGLAGGSLTEIVGLTTLVPASVCLHKLAMLHVCANHATLSHTVQFLLDFVVLVLPALLSVTVPQHAPLLMLALLAAAMVLYVRLPSRVAVEPDAADDDRRPFLGWFRGTMLLMTCIAILAVDFPIFPRRFAKTEQYGTSVMDLGVGSFMFANGVVSKPSSANDSPLGSYFRRALRGVRSSAPLLVIGLLRLVTTKAAEYQEHASEYGVHWNFFFTLASVAIFVALVRPEDSNWPAGVFGLALIIGYEVALYKFGGADYVMNAPRAGSFIALNREGIFSIAGYAGIYLVACELANWFRSRATWWPWRWIRLAFFNLLLWCLLTVYSLFVLPSRRLVNASYVLWSLAHSVFLLVCLIGIDGLLLQRSRGYIPQGVLIPAINRNMLPFFMLCNLLTGLVNFSMQTIYASDSVAFSVLVLYMAVASAVVCVLHCRQISLKVW